jgi:hypothetical protein
MDQADRDFLYMVGESIAAHHDKPNVPCIHCKTPSFPRFRSDGICSECREKGLPGIKELNRREEEFFQTIRMILIASAVVAGAVFLRFSMGG